MRLVTQDKGVEQRHRNAHHEKDDDGKETNEYPFGLCKYGSFV